MNALFYQLLGKWNHRQNVCFHVGSNLKRTSMLLIAFSFVLSALAAACTQQTNPQDCTENKCEMIGNTEVCTQCKAGKVPINGACADPAGSSAKCKNADNSGNADQTCGKCLGATFMYKGGCYDRESAPGNVICKTPGDTDGVCDECQDGYFRHSTPVDTKDSCISCDDTAGVDHNKGIANCKTCVSPGSAGTADTPQTATCTGEAADKCTSCTAGTHFLGATSGEGPCVSCGTVQATWSGVKDCAKCNEPADADTPAVCTECAANLYVKADVGVMACVAASECGEGFFPATVGGVKKCVSCDETDNGGVETCAKCALKTPVPEAGTVVTCSECDGSKKLSPLKDACLNSCPDGTYDKQNVCAPCHSSCASCTDATSATCTACYPGFVLNATAGASAGTCVQECTGKYAENCADGQCTAVVGGSKYCSKCRAGFAPVDGVCVSSTTTRAPTGCTPGTDGTCTACTDTYFLQSGGCYQSTKYPGNTLCSNAASGKCTQCTNGQQADNNSGSCPACDPTCKTCTAKEDPNACSACFPGYYKSGNSCIKCDANDSQITGVSGCLSCAPPSGNQGSVICYITKDGGSGGGNTNKSGLSTGAIAGISVAAIVVVGGLVGFLCWWFICRGRA
ncbi:VSP S8 [Giardia lamblia P15]|uniref:VSP S8 n=1 Tax=Giardia intestinalis (strain P15) TaxID=658858 RepID=E1F987_GIAIA|nr:VSP S8 [Giardia lamblia P15]